MPQGYGLNAPNVHFKPITWDWVTGQLAKSRNYWIATTRKDGRPHVAPVWGLWLKGQVMFSTDSTSLKARNAARNPACTVHLESGDDVVILEGRLEQVTAPSLLKQFVDAYDAKYGIRPEVGPEAGPGGGPVFALRHRTVLAWIEKDFPSTATRWEFE
jgi:hypothetical protein